MNTCGYRASHPSKFSPEFMISKALQDKGTLVICVLLMFNIFSMATAHIAILENIKLINENSTLVHPLMNLTQNATQGIEKTDLGVLPWWCHYSSDLEENENESECHCEGPKLMKIPQNLPQITRLSIANAKFKVLREAGLRKYSSSLRDL